MQGFNLSFHVYQRIIWLLILIGLVLLYYRPDLMFFVMLAILFVLQSAHKLFEKQQARRYQYRAAHSIADSMHLVWLVDHEKGLLPLNPDANIPNNAIITTNAFHLKTQGKSDHVSALSISLPTLKELETQSVWNPVLDHTLPLAQLLKRAGVRYMVLTRNVYAQHLYWLINGIYESSLYDNTLNGMWHTYPNEEHPLKGHQLTGVISSEHQLFFVTYDRVV